MPYKHTQSGYLAVAVLVSFLVIFGAVVAWAGDEDPASFVIIGLSMLSIAAVVLWFNWLTVTVDGDEVVAFFGLGRPQHNIELRDIAGFRQVRNKWYFGFGIRKLPDGWMYNVSGLDAVELELADGKTFRIGTNEPADLVAALVAHTSLRPTPD